MNSQRDSRRMAPEKVTGGRIKDKPFGRELGPEKIIPLSEIAKAATAVAPMSFDDLVERICKPDIDRLWTIEDIPCWGWRELHPLSFGAGFLLSSLFWLTIGIALQIISR